MSDLRFSPEEMKARGYGPEAVDEARRAREARAAALELVERLERVFENMPRPRITLSVARALDDEWLLSKERFGELSAIDPETDWRDVPDTALEAHQEYFTFTDAEGWRFYLPAFLRRYLKEFPYSGHEAAYWACTEPERLATLTAEQRACVDEFLTLCHRYQPPF